MKNRTPSRDAADAEFGSSQSANGDDSRCDPRHLLRHLTILIARCVIHLDREVLLLPSGACACARGVAGHSLTARTPEATRRFFKPGQGGNAPAAFVLQPAVFDTRRGRTFPFSIFSWEPSGAFLNSLLDAFGATAGRPWGDTKARIEAFDCLPPERLAFQGFDNSSSRPLRLWLRTPVAIKAHERDRSPRPDEGDRSRSRRRLLTPAEITVGRIVQALVNRINNIGIHFGAGARIDPQPFLAETALVRELRRDMRTTRARRQSSSQKKEIYLDGVTGWMDLDRVPRSLRNLLALGEVFHLGHRTADGCGCVTIENLTKPDDE